MIFFINKLKDFPINFVYIDEGGVITNDKKELEKIKDFDTIGGAIEIEFSSTGRNDLYTGR